MLVIEEAHEEEVTAATGTGGQGKGGGEEWEVRGGRRRG